MSTQFLHTMVRVGDLGAALRFFCDGLGLTEIGRYDNEGGRFTLVFLASPADIARMGGIPKGVSPTQMDIPMVELTHNWTRRTMPVGAISATSPTASMTSTPPPSALPISAFPSAARLAMAG
jgi:catechol 2,3-dioxygenase-like lactoylglutathione lyase family enzyme